MVTPLLGVNQSSPFGMTMTQSPSTKLDKANFLLWRTTIMPIINGHNLQGFISGSSQCPPEYISTEVEGQEAQVSPNPEFAKWKATDKLLMGWLYSSMSPEVAIKVMGSSTSCKLWQSVQELFGVMNRSRVVYLTGELQRIRKGNKTMDEYLTQFKQLVDNLEIASREIKLNEQISQVLDGLDRDYDAIITQISHMGPITWQMLQSMLLTFESRLKYLNGVTSELAAVNLSHSRATTEYRPQYNNQYNNQRGGRTGNNGRNNNGRGGNRSQGRGRRSNNNQNCCQICGLANHTAERCYNRYNENYMGSKPMENTSRNNNSAPSAYAASSNTASDSGWFADLGASHHVAADKENLITSSMVDNL